MPKNLNPAHLRRAELALCKHEQEKHFQHELKAIRKEIPMDKDSPLRQLHPVMHDGVLRVGSQLKHADIPVDAKAPIILPQDSLLSTTLVQHHHLKTAHGGRARVVAELRYTHWVVGAKTLTGKLLKKCRPCRARDTRSCIQAMGQLPEDRVRSGEPAFTYVGVDCFGPFFVSKGRAKVIWLLLHLSYCSSHPHRGASLNGHL